MRKTLLFIMSIVLLLNINLVFAHEHNFAETKQLIDSEISCDKLTDEQLEAMGDYYMEQMHPGEAHEMMDQMMGGKGSDSLKQMHIQITRGIYCNEDVGGMMSMMMGNNTTDSEMMGSYGYGSIYWNFLNVLYILLLTGLIILVFLWIIRLWKSIKHKGSKNKD